MPQPAGLNLNELKKSIKYFVFEKQDTDCKSAPTGEILKSTYNLEFLGLMKPVKELKLERRLVEKIKLFLPELGNGFTFVGNQ